jgi:1-deoxy-D-xylulose-5-phosphate reductoisomerase
VTVRRVVILGSTGSIGTQALDVIARNRDAFAVEALVAGGANPALLAQQAIDTGASVVGVAQAQAAQDLQLALYAEAQRRGFAEGGFQLPRIVAGPDAATQIARIPADVVLNAMTGAVGLEPTLAALEGGATLALANKESLIIGGPLVRSAARPDQIVPVDSEHSAIAQCLRGGSASEVRRLVLTASGGPFRGWTRSQMADVTAEQALAHPTWSMGPLVTINSATMMNKGLEIIEAHLLFDIPIDRIDVVVHPQSIVHSMVEFVDGSTLAQASPPDMRIAIALALGWPHRIANAGPGCDWTEATTWTFEPVDATVFPAVALARLAGVRGGTAPAVMNAADEVAVEAFLQGHLTFAGIVEIADSVVSEHLSDTSGGDGASWVPGNQVTIQTVQAADRWARTRAWELVESR